MSDFKQPISEALCKRKYFLHGEHSLNEIFSGVAQEIASKEKEFEKWKKIFYSAMFSGELIPAGRILANARPNSPMKNYNNCYTIDVEDSMEGIFEALKEDALISKMGGGVGFNVSKLRPRGAKIKTGGQSSGALSFLEIFDASAKSIHTGGGRRCLPKDAKVFTKDKIKDIKDVTIGDKVLTSTGYERVANVFKQGIQKTIIIKTRQGDFECTPNHKMPVFTFLDKYEWKRADELVKGDRLVYVANGIDGQKTELPKWKYINPIHSTTCKDIVIPKLNTDIAWFFGYLLGNGYVHLNKQNTKGNVSLSIPSDKQNIINKANSILSKFGTNVVVKLAKEGTWVNIKTESKQLATYLSQFKKPNEDIHIPLFIMQGTREIRYAFIAGLFDADGSSKNRPLRAVSTVYKSLSDELRLLFNSIGMPTTVRFTDRSNIKNWKNIYNVNISNVVSVKKWDIYIAPYSLKYESTRNKRYRAGCNDIGWDVSMVITSKIPIASKLWSNNAKQLSVLTYEKAIEKEVSLYPIEIVAIENGRETETFDIEVENKHEFVVNGFLTHNSAHIAILNIDHPDIEEFITYKQGDENKRLTQFNISVGITNKFIEAVENDEDWDLVFEGKIYKTLKARELYDKMTKHAWWYNEPGALFLDTVEENNNGHHAFKMDRTNPCGEITMPSYSLCCLSAINLSKFVRKPFTEDAYFDYNRFGEVVKIGVRFLDNVLDVTEYPLEKIKELSLQWRRIGLGITGLADAMLMLGIRYGDERSLSFVDLLGEELAHQSYRASVALAKEKGAFPAFDKNIGDYGFIKKLDKELQKDIKKYGLRNIGLNTIAPTGTTSLTLGNNCSSGIEPIFALQYDRTVRNDDDTTYIETVYDNGWLEYLEYVTQNKLEIDPENLPDYVVTSHDVKIKEGIDVQAAFQYWIDHSISKTINMPYKTTLEEYKDIFMYAWQKGLKGVTSFHEGASMAGILSTGNKNKEIPDNRHAVKRPKELPCDIYEMQVNKKRVIALVGLLDNKPYEVFLTDDPDEMINVKHAKEGTIVKIKTGCYDLHIEGKRGEYILKDISSVFDDEWGTLGRLVSMSLRHNVPLQFIVDQLSKTKQFNTFSKGMGRVLKKYIEDGEKALTSAKCPECGNELIFKEGCKNCTSCGWSKCD